MGFRRAGQAALRGRLGLDRSPFEVALSEATELDGLSSAVGQLLSKYERIDSLRDTSSLQAPELDGLN